MRRSARHASRAIAVGATALLLLAAGAAASAPSARLPSGQWVWSGVFDGGTPSLWIAESDMRPGVGPDAWPGCPKGIVCTRHGIHRMSLREDGSFRYSINVRTSSDFTWVGSAHRRGGSLAIHVHERYSCAHPRFSRRVRLRAQSRFAVDGDQLRLAVARHAGSAFPFTARAAAARQVIEFRRVSSDAFGTRYRIEICQPLHGAPCDPRCGA